MDSSVPLTHVLALKSSATLHRSTFFSTSTRSNSSSLSPSPSPSALSATVKTSTCLLRQPSKTAQRNVQRQRVFQRQPVNSSKTAQCNVLLSTCLLRQSVQSTKLNVNSVLHVAPVKAICSKSYPNETKYTPVQLAAQVQLARGPSHHRLSRHRLQFKAQNRLP